MLNFHLFRFTAFLVLVLSFETLFAQEIKPVRVGILGIDNYQSVAYTQLFNDPKATGDLAGLKVVAAFPSTPSMDIPESVDSLPKWKEALSKYGVKMVASVD
jgi:hypothetical protein